MYCQWMAVKTITIDTQAYKLLARRKRKGQSFSQVIKEHLSSSTASGLLAALESVSLDERTLDLIDERIEDRAASPARSAEL